MGDFIENHVHSFIDDFFAVGAAVFKPAAEFFDGGRQQVNGDDVIFGFFFHLRAPAQSMVESARLHRRCETVNFRGARSVTGTVLGIDIFVKAS